MQFARTWFGIIPESKYIVKQVLQLFKNEVMTKFSHFRECINHGDLNDHNILMESSKSAFGDVIHQVSGILDFDDMSYGYYVFEVAIAIMYMMIESENPMHVEGHVLAGFESDAFALSVDLRGAYAVRPRDFPSDAGGSRDSSGSSAAPSGTPPAAATVKARFSVEPRDGKDGCANGVPAVPSSLWGVCFVSVRSAMKFWS
ncbi:Hydroxylysine kinase [Manis javanica]|nr:Hydroxylysine kinase [Manis javanica]